VNRIWKILVLAAAAMLVLTSCFIPDGAYTYISKDQLDVLTSLGMPINKGMFPPDVTGSYYCDSLVLKDSNISGDDPGYDTYLNMEIQFYDQGDGTVFVSYNQSDVEIGSGLGSYISGFGKDFTVYAEIDGNYSGVDFKDAMVFSGTMTAGGIADFTYALLLTWKDYDPTPYLIDVGDARVIEEYDGLAANYLGASSMLNRVPQQGPTANAK
jgi:hypothetical protein